MTVVGVDGCSSGWCGACYDDGNISIDIYPNIQDLIKECSKAVLILIDIPIGLGDEKIIREMLRC